MVAQELKRITGETFDEWADRNGYVKSSFVEAAYPTTAETTVIDVTVPEGETWYTRNLTVTASGRQATYRIYRTEPGGVEAQVGRIACPNNGTQPNREGNPKLLAGTRIRIRVLADALAAAGDRVSARLTTVRLPWSE